MRVWLARLLSTRRRRSVSTDDITKSRFTGPIRLTIVCAVLLSALVVSGSGFFLSNLHDRIRTVNERNLANIALVLATQIEQFFTTAERVQAGLIKDIAAIGSIDTPDGERLLSRHEIHLKLRDKAVGMP
jgi:hypothetical protein